MVVIPSSHDLVCMYVYRVSLHPQLEQVNASISVRGLYADMSVASLEAAISRWSRSGTLPPPNGREDVHEVDDVVGDGLC